VKTTIIIIIPVCSTGGRFRSIRLSIGTLGIRWGSGPRIGTIILAIIIRPRTRICAVILVIVIRSRTTCILSGSVQFTVLHALPDKVLILIQHFAIVQEL
jgi:hypothetical protein